ncbi:MULTISPECIES: TauD/TfdA family dioxygenase [unclassified Actinoplanes]|uniref:TauD/TfdA family dioxygenase n=1 Tax=unclassified Actinoplanes TaxID=2626549 RepID=UPI0012BA7E0F|nr:MULTISPECIES: TauD/TfdA family dioxygenase [unclassified Actinoplanes]
MTTHSDDIVTAYLAPAESADMARRARREITGTGAPGDCFRRAGRHAGILPARLREALARLRAGSLDAVVAHGLPADPTDADAPPLLGLTWLGMLTRQLGHEFGYPAEQNGTLVHHVRPRPDRAATQSNASSAVDLRLHTEIAFHDVRPDFVLLYGVRSPEPRPATRLVRVADAVRNCSPETVQRLRRPQFRINAPDSFSPGQAVAENVAPMGGTLRQPTIRWHSSITGVDDVDQCAIAEFQAAADREEHLVRLAPGSFLAFSNSRCLHGRDAFEAHYDGHDRWLLRTYVRHDLTRGRG